MSARYRFTKSARQDLLEIADYISDDDPAAAERVVDQIVEAIERLCQFPAMGHVDIKLAGPRHRLWPVSRYLLIYRPDTDPLQIVRIWDPARGKPRLR
ncbi:MAG: type II toxin-antitoxin system RelE/ParE family toxin [Deltaproteobacteria bacterium]|nr:type II toxin-antitoxin system RelE/ParE family toxin [Deltaproteobacteria bacterium]MBI3388357.1 type II toxin-antitoxin system RelE/ParE family toxin [Deltaproteobacteria bacterium]